MTATARDDLIQTLRARFEANTHRHEGTTWEDIHARVEGDAAAIRSLSAMEDTGGEPDVIGRDAETGVVTFCDFAAESPDGRRSLCYDREALDPRKKHKPRSCAIDVAREMGIDLLTEEQYRALQSLGEFDTRTSSWIATPADVRSRGGALFCDRRFGRVFVYHNGAQSYYAARGFRGMLRV